MPRKGEVPKRKPLPDPKFTDQIDRHAPPRDEVRQHGHGRRARRRSPSASSTAPSTSSPRRPRTIRSRCGTARSPTCSPRSRSSPAGSAARPTRCRSTFGRIAPLALGMRWLIGAARDRSDGRTMQEKLAGELLDASSNKGNCGQEARRYAQDGGRQQGVRPLPLVVQKSGVRQVVRQAGQASGRDAD